MAPFGALTSSSEGSSLTAAGWAFEGLGHPSVRRETSISPESRLLGLPQGEAVPPHFGDSSPPIDIDALAQLHAAVLLECELRVDPAYLHRHQSECTPPSLRLTASMRRMGLGWLVEVGLDQGLTQETLALAASLLDRFMSLSRGVKTTQFQMLCCACLLVAAKHEEELHPAVGELTSLSAGSFTAAELRAAELAVLQMLSFRVNCPTSYTFLLLLARLLDLSPRSRALACYLTELAMLEYGVLGYAPSQIATAAVVLAGLRLGEALPRPALQACLELLPGVSDREEPSEMVRNHRSSAALQPLLRALLALHQSAYVAPAGSEAATIRDKFRAFEWQGAGTIKPFERLPQAYVRLLVPSYDASAYWCESDDGSGLVPRHEQ